MKKIVLSLLFLVYLLNAHPVSYTIELKVTYDEVNKQAKIECHSNSKNKCGLYSFDLLNKNGDILLTKRFPFLKKHTVVKVNNKPSRMKFFLRKIPKHTYLAVVE